jgi:hypothetical protein
MLLAAMYALNGKSGLLANTIDSDLRILCGGPIDEIFET